MVRIAKHPSLPFYEMVVGDETGIVTVILDGGQDIQEEMVGDGGQDIEQEMFDPRYPKAFSGLHREVVEALMNGLPGSVAIESSNASSGARPRPLCKAGWIDSRPGEF